MGSPQIIHILVAHDNVFSWRKRWISHDHQARHRSLLWHFHERGTLRQCSQHLGLLQWEVVQPMASNQSIVDSFYFILIYVVLSWFILIMFNLCWIMLVYVKCLDGLCTVCITKSHHHLTNVMMMMMMMMLLMMMMTTMMMMMVVVVMMMMMSNMQL